jgi:hypothetical protein
LAERCDAAVLLIFSHRRMSLAGHSPFVIWGWSWPMSADVRYVLAGIVRGGVAVPFESSSISPNQDQVDVHNSMPASAKPASPELNSIESVVAPPPNGTVIGRGFLERTGATRRPSPLPDPMSSPTAKT